MWWLMHRHPRHLPKAFAAVIVIFNVCVWGGGGQRESALLPPPFVYSLLVLKIVV